MKDEVIDILRDILEEVKSSNQKTEEKFTGIQDAVEKMSSGETPLGFGENLQEQGKSKLEGAAESVGTALGVRTLGGNPAAMIAAKIGEEVAKAISGAMSQNFAADKSAQNAVLDRVQKLGEYGIEVDKDQYINAYQTVREQKLKGVRARQSAANTMGLNDNTGAAWYVQELLDTGADAVSEGYKAVTGEEIDARGWVKQKQTDIGNWGYDRYKDAEDSRLENMKDESERRFFKASQKSAMRNQKINNNHRTNSTWGS